MKAMIFAAGLGTRLRPITNNMPKALVEVGHVPLLEIAIRRLKHFGCEAIIINIHHFGEQVLEFLENKNNFGIPIEISDERDLLLDTGGGLKKAAWFLKDAPFLVYNADIITDLNLHLFYQSHLQNKALATLAVRDRPSSRHLLFNQENVLCGWVHNKTGARKICRADKNTRALAFSGLHVLSPEIFEWMPEKPVFSIIDVYLEAGKTQDVVAFPHDESIWLDVGKIPALKKAVSLIQELDIDLNDDN